MQQLAKKTFGSRALAVLLVSGGLLGISTGVILGLQLLAVSLLMILPVSMLLAVNLWAVVAGIALWRGTARGWKWGSICYAMQIPILAIHGASYEFFTGLALKLMGGEVDKHLSLQFGATFDFFSDITSTSLFYGINLLAVMALIYLRRSRPDRVPEAETEAQPEASV
ncbi:hypothetical protein [Pseudomonas sp. GV071]|uniref:hypothetical protein n=1 Tax=Pseudomonas sp. GV071 TaxID=2135754 RepID=UPI000D3786C6|nr:hypothetical protein [Pseudomonas sp. GV071]PTQ70622.1 hypothetical protein C8K61_106349 [Pseudomonas sp. GV071]